MIEGGALCIIIGVLLLFWGIKYPTKGDYGAADFKLNIGAIGFIVVGIAIIADALGC